MVILVTAFGPFGGRTTNASMLAIAALKKTHTGIRTRILPVDAVIAPARLKQAMKKIRPDILIMLGEAGGSKTIRLERTAWNEMDFRIPDIAGRQPVKRLIDPNGPESFASTLPLDSLLGTLDCQGHRVSFSDDPGRYLCNQVFYTALSNLSEINMTCQAGFIHIPLENDYSTSKICDALTLMIQKLEQPSAVI